MFILTSMMERKIRLDLAIVDIAMLDANVFRKHKVDAARGEATVIPMVDICSWMGATLASLPEILGSWSSTEYYSGFHVLMSSFV